MTALLIIGTLVPWLGYAAYLWRFYGGPKCPHCPRRMSRKAHTMPFGIRFRSCMHCENGRFETLDGRAT